MNPNVYKYELLEELKTNKESFGKGVIVETGAGSPFYSILCREPNTASKLVKYALSPTDWEYTKTHYYLNSEIRAVSKETCKAILKGELEANPKARWILCNSIQIGNDSATQTHGWIGLYANGSYSYYHFSIDNFWQEHKRKDLISIIEVICLDVFLSMNAKFYLTNGYIDICDNFLLEDYGVNKMLIECIVNAKSYDPTDFNKDSYAIFKKDSKRGYYNPRMNDILREAQGKEIVLFKGSFDPMHDMHYQIYDEITKDTNKFPIFMISVSSVLEKKVSSDSIYKRIKVLNELGFPVIINKKGKFEEAIIHFTDHQDFKNCKLSFVLGSDILDRLIQDYKNGFNYLFDDVLFYEVGRILETDQRHPHDNIHNLHVATLPLKYNKVSSSAIRNAIDDKNADVLDKLYENKKLLEVVKKHYEI